MRDWVGEARRIRLAFEQEFGSPPSVMVRAPGRLNLLGSHVDHQEGWVLPGAIDRAVFLAARPNRSGLLRLHALDLGLEAIVDLRQLEGPSGERPLEWSDYPAGVAWALLESFQGLPGLNAVFGGNLPREAGMSSSAAVEVAFLMAWRALADLDLDRKTMAQLGQYVENEYLGIASGVMDQFASLFGQRDHLMQIDCRSLEHEAIAFPDSVRLLIADSGTRRQLGRSGYNDPQKDCAEATKLLQRKGWSIRSLRDLTPGDLEAVRPILDSAQVPRVEHVVEECARVSRGCEHLRHGDLEDFGQLLNLSHASSRDLWRVSTPELDLLAESAAASDGCLGARLSGAGLGGCVLALVRPESIESTRQAMQSAFNSRFGRIPETRVCRVTDGAEVFSCE